MSKALARVWQKYLAVKWWDAASWSPEAARRDMVATLLAFTFSLSVPLYFLVPRMVRYLDSNAYLERHLQAKSVVQEVNARLAQFDNQSLRGLNTSAKEQLVEESLNRVMAERGEFLISQFDRRAAPRPKPAPLSFSTLNQQPPIIVHYDKLAPPFEEIPLVFQTPMKLLTTGRGIAYLDLGLLLMMITAGLITIYRTSLGQIEFANRQQNFVAAVSHELKAPLTAVKMYAELIKGHSFDDLERQSEYAGRIYRESERLERLVKNVLLFSELQARDQRGALPLERLLVKDIASILKTSLADLVNHSGFELQLTVDRHLSPESAVAIHRDGLTTIIFNLVDNALKFSQAATIKRIEISIENDSKGKGIAFKVRDFGPGVGDEFKGKLFRAFNRGEDELTRKTKGSGIGLALSRILSTKMGGELSYSDASPGAIFSLVLPLKA